VYLVSFLTPLQHLKLGFAMRVRFGLIGYGLFGAHHARAIERCAAAELVAIAVPSAASRQRAIADHPAVIVLEDYRQLLERSDIDVVSIVAPNQLHSQLARDSFMAGKHVLLEKPMALSVSACEELNAVARQQHRMLAVGHELRLSSLWGGVKELIEAGEIGRPLHVLIELSRFPYRQGSQGWRYDLSRVGSWILEEPIHFFDLARWYLAAAGEPTAIYAAGNSRQPEHPELRDNFSAIVHFPGGAYAVISQTLAAFGHHQTAKVTGTEGTIWAWWSAADARSERSQYGLRYGLGADVTEVTLDRPAGELLELADEIAAVARCVQTGDQPPCTGEDGCWSTRLCLAAEVSLAYGQVVRL